VGTLAVRQGPNPSPAWDIPQVHASVIPIHGQAADIQGKADGESERRPVGERDECAAVGQLPEMIALKNRALARK
jgi:hypothetical protein